MTVNQILVICLIVVLVGFLVVFAKLGIQAVDLIKKIKDLVAAFKKFVGFAEEKVDKVGDSLSETAANFVANADTNTKLVGAASVGIIGCSLIGAIFKRLFRKKSRKANRRVRKSERELKSAAKAAKRAKKIQKKARKLAKVGLL